MFLVRVFSSPYFFYVNFGMLLRGITKQPEIKIIMDAPSFFRKRSNFNTKEERLNYVSRIFP